MSASKDGSQMQTLFPARRGAAFMEGGFPFISGARVAVGALIGCKEVFLPKLEKPDGQPGLLWQSPGLPAGA